MNLHTIRVQVHSFKEILICKDFLQIKISLKICTSKYSKCISNLN